MLRKASEPASVQYNGSEPIVISSEGKVNDYFNQKDNGSIKLLTKKNVKEVLEQVCGSSNAIENGQLDKVTIQQALEACDKH